MADEGMAAWKSKVELADTELETVSGGAVKWLGQSGKEHTQKGNSEKARPLKTID